MYNFSAVDAGQHRGSAGLCGTLEVFTVEGWTSFSLPCLSCCSVSSFDCFGLLYHDLMLKQGRIWTSTYTRQRYQMPVSTCIFFLNLKILLTCSWLTMPYWFLLYNKVIQPCIYMHLFFFRFFSHIGYHRTLRRGPCAVQQVPPEHPLQYNSMYTPTPNLSSTL